MANGLTPIFCIGEVLEEREANKQNEVVAAQMESVFSLSAEDFSKIVLAYEPVWAIGTGKTASPEQAQEIHAFIRSIVADKYGKEIADNTSILYGGSCKPSNAKELFANPDVDGGLIGGAALKVSDFKGIIDPQTFFQESGIRIRSSNQFFFKSVVTEPPYFAAVLLILFMPNP